MKNNSNNEKSKKINLINQILNDTAMITINKYRLKPVGSGIASPGGPIQELCLAFNSYDNLLMPELRKLLFQISNDLVNRVNLNKEIQQFLYKQPFDKENVQIVIYNHDKNGRNLFDPDISTAEISHGFLTYRTVDPENYLRFKHEYKETYNEALKVILEDS